MTLCHTFYNALVPEPHWCSPRGKILNWQIALRSIPLLEIMTNQLFKDLLPVIKSHLTCPLPPLPYDWYTYSLQQVRTTRQTCSVSVHDFLNQCLVFRCYMVHRLFRFAVVVVGCISCILRFFLSVIPDS